MEQKEPQVSALQELDSPLRIEEGVDHAKIDNDPARDARAAEGDEGIWREMISEYGGSWHAASVATRKATERRESAAVALASVVRR